MSMTVRSGTSNGTSIGTKTVPASGPQSGLGTRAVDIEALIAREVTHYAERARARGLPEIADERHAVRSVADQISGYGALQPLFDDSTIEEIWINAPDRIFVAREGVAEQTSLSIAETETQRLVERMLWQAGRRIDASMPFVDASLPDGSRLHVVIPDISHRHWAVNIRKFSRSIRSLGDLVMREALTQQAAEFLRMSVLAGLNIIVSGSTQAGKTTMLNALLSESRPTERIVTVEETRELDVRANDLVALQCRAANLEGAGEVSLRRLISEALRMRPNRLVVGEVRGAECLDLLIALNSGLAGACSVHANSAREALGKLCALPLLAGGNVDARFVAPTVAASVDLVVHCDIDRGGYRRVREIATVAAVSGEPHTESLLMRTAQGLVPTGRRPSRTEKFERAGLDPVALLERRS
jgi:pilus assembly protein CpaF